MGVPPVMVTFVFVFGAGDVARDEGFESEISRPEAEGGNFGVDARDGTLELLAEPVIGACKAARVGSRAKAFDKGGSFLCLDDDLELM